MNISQDPITIGRAIPDQPLKLPTGFSRQNEAV